MRRFAWLLLWLSACHPRVEAPADSRDESTCLEAMIRVVRDRVDAGALTLDVSETWACARGDERIVRLATVPLVEQPGCPAGQAALEAGPERVVLPDFVARLDRGHVLQVTAALREFTERDRGQFGRAFVVACTGPTAQWLFLRTDPTPEVRAFGARVTPMQEISTQQAPSLVAAATPESDVATQQPPAARGNCTESLDIGETVWRGRSLSTGLMPGPSHLTIATLGRTKARATLVIQAFRATKASGAPDDAQPSGEWACVSSSVAHGAVEGSSPFRVRFEDRTLRCTAKVLGVAEARARRVRVPSKEEGCNASRWAPATRHPLQVLSCVDPAEAEAGTGRPLLMSAMPGVEHVTYDNDDCGDPNAALRRIPADGGVAPAMRISEQPLDFVPAGLRRPRTP